MCSKDSVPEARTFGIVHLINLPRIVVEILPYLVTKVGVGVAVADNLNRAVHSDCAVVGGDYHLEPHL